MTIQMEAVAGDGETQFVMSRQERIYLGEETIWIDCDVNLDAAIDEVNARLKLIAEMAAQWESDVMRELSRNRR